MLFIDLFIHLFIYIFIYLLIFICGATLKHFSLFECFLTFLDEEVEFLFGCGIRFIAIYISWLNNLFFLWNFATFKPGTDPTFVIRGGPNSEMFLPDLRNYST